jgi:lipopolysaccharide transport system ATP-binding protein
MSTSAVALHHVWKKFRRGERHDSLRDLLPSAAGRLFRRRDPNALTDTEFWALRDVSFEVRPGEALGILGPNGAGKSTILKVLTRILRPTRGECELRGRVGALIELAAGFHPDLTGRENVYLQGAIMGMKRADIARQFDAIVDFAGIAEHIDTPVKRYSSGMTARLGFAIAAHLDPDVLLVDEVLSVGDVAFQEKCIARMRAMLGRGLPLIFISHNLRAVVDLCTRAVVLDRGALVYDGSPTEAVKRYRAIRHVDVGGHEDQPAPAALRITGVELLSGDAATSAFRTAEELRVRVFYHASAPTAAHVAVDLYNADGLYCAGINTQMDRRNLGPLEGRGHCDLVVPRLPLLPGWYVVSAGLLDARSLEPIDVQHRVCAFTVTSTRTDFGVVCIDHRWEHTPLVPRDAAVREPSIA